MEKDTYNKISILSDKIMSYFNISDYFEIGVGFWGVVYDIGDKILKITTDLTEIENAFKLLGENTNHFPHIYNIHKVDFDKQSYGVIIAEKLEKMVTLTQYNIIQEKLESILGTLDYEFPIEDEDVIFNTFYNYSLNRLPNNVIKEVKKIPFIKSLFKIDKEAKKYNIKIDDIHYGNLAINGNKLVLIDLGGYGEEQREADIKIK